MIATMATRVATIILSSAYLLLKLVSSSNQLIGNDSTDKKSTMQQFKATRQSIKQSVLLVGSNNPITVHNVDVDLFTSVWSVIAETMVVNGDISRYVQCTMYQPCVRERADTRFSACVLCVCHSRACTARQGRKWQGWSAITTPASCVVWRTMP
jgi:hypothetical protein